MSLAYIISNYQNFFFDLDGVVWECENLLPGVSDLLSLLESQSKKIYYMSNNASRSRSDFIELFRRLGIPAKLENIVCAGYACASYLTSQYPINTKVLVIGCKGAIEEIELAGYEVVSSVDMESIHVTTDNLGSIAVDPDIKVVVVGFTPKLNFYMLAYALNCLKAGAKLLTGNYDCSDKFGAYNAPGSACTVEFLRYSLDLDFINVGKPEKFMLDRIIDLHKLNKSESIMIGDKMATDILLAKKASIDSLLVLTGYERPGTYENLAFQPNYILENLVLT
jgi:HAD superfamily hydrolase (TIGR01450 family)